MKNIIGATILVTEIVWIGLLIKMVL